MGFAAEEFGLKGSKDIANYYRSCGKNVVGMVNFDMVGYSKHYQRILLFMDREWTNDDQTYFLMDLIQLYLPCLLYTSDAADE